ncbi:MAG: class I SAM-dependent methyltransferase [Chloroflexota bacterium]|nr:class I SAM-dependent methyltransferase [Chloroflexota bacterium]
MYTHRGRIVACLGCGLARRDPIPSSEELLSIYSASDYFQLSGDSGIGYRDYFADAPVYRPYFRRAFAVLHRYASPPGALLEVGAGAGFALKAARDAGWDGHGLELSGAAAAWARQRFGVDIAVGGVDDVHDHERWDVIAAFQTIEHLVDVRAALRRVREALRWRGVVFLTTPDHGSLSRRAFRRFWLSYRPEHLVYFDQRSLRRLLEEEGFRVELIGADDPLVVPVHRLFERAAHYYLRRRVEPPVIPWCRVPVWLGDMRVIARKT